MINKYILRNLIMEKLPIGHKIGIIGINIRSLIHSIIPGYIP